MRNTVKTAVLLSALGVVLVAGGAAIGRGTGLVIGLVLALALTGGSYWFSDRIAVRAAGAVPVTEQQVPEYHAIVRDLCGRSGLPMPQLYISPAQQPNAFATGRNPDHAAVCVTAGILQICSWDELRGVLAHEMSHVGNRDILISSVAATLAMAITMLARLAWFADIFAGGNRRDGEQGMFASLALIIFAPLAAGLLQLALSRSREYQADASGAALIGDGEPLARALEKLDTASRQIPMPQTRPEMAALFIVNPLNGRQVNFGKFFSDHPPTAERVARLRQRSWQRR